MTAENQSQLKTVTAAAKDLTKQSSVFNADQMALLHRRTPKKHTFARPAKGGGEWTYVTGQYVEMYLNALTGYDWDFEVTDFKQMDKHVVVLGKLTIRVGQAKGERRQIVKTQFGRAEVKTTKTGDILDIGNDFKAAATDALKKCASLLGIAWDIYGKDEFAEINVEKNAAPVSATIAKAIKKCASRQELEEYVLGLSLEDRKRAVPLASERMKELEEAA